MDCGRQKRRLELVGLDPAFVQVRSLRLAEDRGFEPLRAVNPTRFPSRRIGVRDRSQGSAQAWDQPFGNLVNAPHRGRMRPEMRPGPPGSGLLIRSLGGVLRGSAKRPACECGWVFRQSIGADLCSAVAVKAAVMTGAPALSESCSGRSVAVGHVVVSPVPTLRVSTQPLDRYPGILECVPLPAPEPKPHRSMLRTDNGRNKISSVVHSEPCPSSAGPSARVGVSTAKKQDPRSLGRGGSCLASRWALLGR